MPTASVEIVFALANGSTLILGSGARWETVGDHRVDALTVESEIVRLRRHTEDLRTIANKMRAKHGKDPIK